MRTLRVRRPAVAGTFYPSDADALRAAVVALLGDADAGTSSDRPPKAIVAPHAGYTYSGAVAARAYATVHPLQGQVERVVLLGPAHRSPLAVVGASTADAFETPLGLVTVDTDAREELVDAGLVALADEAHASEHSLEVQLPFVQVTLGEVTVLPLVVGPVAASSVADVLDRVWGGGETLIVVSTDLSHYHDRATATELDRRTAAAVAATQPEALGQGDACGLYALRGMLEAARRKALAVEVLDLRTSADAGGADDRVVGYGAFALSDQS